MVRKSPAPSPLTAETTDIDDSWDDLGLDAPREPSKPPQTKDVFDRVTTVPQISPEELARDSLARPTPTTARPADESLPESSPRAAGFDLDLDLEDTDATSGPALDGPSVDGDARVSDLSLDRAIDPDEQLDDLILEEDPPSEAAKGDPFDDLDLQIDGALGQSPALDLVEENVLSSAPPAAASADVEAGPASDQGGGTLNDMQDRYAVGDFTGALVVAESILETDPTNEEAQRYAKGCREVLTQMYAARLGSLEQIVTVAVPPEQITWLSLDHRAGFLLSLVDGVSSIEEILDVSGMTRLDALRILYTLVQQNVISLG